jgi:hypothetical protein
MIPFIRVSTCAVHGTRTAEASCEHYTVISRGGDIAYVLVNLTVHECMQYQVTREIEIGQPKVRSSEKKR